VPSIRDQRLQHEYERLSNYNNPNVEITVISGKPPENYRIKYKCRGVVNQSFSTADVHIVKLEFPAGFPHSERGGSPRFIPETPIWHPNVYENGMFYIGDNAVSPLQETSDLVAKIGMMIEYQEYNLMSPARSADWPRWLNTHSRSIPLGNTNFWIQEDIKPDIKMDVIKRESPAKPEPVITVKRRSPR